VKRRCAPELAHLCHDEREAAIAEEAIGARKVAMELREAKLSALVTEARAAPRASTAPPTSSWSSASGAPAPSSAASLAEAIRVGAWP
jgi:hypothetical protein